MNLTHEELIALQEVARGGFWISPDGLPVPVSAIEGHTGAMRHDGRLADFQTARRGGYGSLITRGAVRITFCAHTFDSCCNYRAVTGEALGTLRVLMKFYMENPPHWMNLDSARFETNYDAYGFEQYDPDLGRYVPVVEAPAEVEEWHADFTLRHEHRNDPERILDDITRFRGGLRSARTAAKRSMQVVA